MTKATHKKTIIDLMKNQKRQQKKAYGLGRQNLTGYTDVAGGFTTMHQVSSASSGGSNSVHPTNIDKFTNFLDPIAFWMHEQLIYPTSGNNNTLDLSEETGAYTSHWIWAAAGSEELEIISNASHSGQILFIESVDTRTPKIVDRSNTSGGTTGNIKTLDGNDYTFPSNKTIILFMFSSIDNLWHQISNPTMSASSGADTDLSNLTATGEAHFANPQLSNLSGTVEVNQNISMEDNNITEIEEIHFNASGTSDGKILGSASGLGYNASTSSDYHYFQTEGISRLRIKTTNVELVSGNHFNAMSSGFIGFHVTDETDVGSLGTVELPYLRNSTYTTLNLPSYAVLDGMFGDFDGACGFWSADSDTAGVVRELFLWRSNGGWKQVTGATF